MNKEIKTLTGLRGAAAVIVAIYHFFDADRYFQSSAPLLILKGYLGVDVFFVLSGFVLSLSYSRYFQDGIKYEKYKDFIIKRFARIYPLYIVVTIVFSVKYMLNLSGNVVDDYHLRDFIACCLMIQGWGFGFTNVAGATWSLSTECLAYIVFPALVLTVIFGRPLYAYVAAAISFLFMVVIVISGEGVGGPLDVVSGENPLPVLRCLAGFMLGVICYKIVLVPNVRNYLSSSLATFIVFSIFLAAIQLNAHDGFIFLLFPVIIVILYYSAALSNIMFANRLVYHLGVISYSIYLVHPLLMSVDTRLEPVVERQFGIIGHHITLIAVILLTWILSYLSYTFIELPGRSYIQKHFVGNRRPLAAATVEVGGPTKTKGAEL